VIPGQPPQNPNAGMPQQAGGGGYNPGGPAGGMGNNSAAVGMINQILRNPAAPPGGFGNSAFGNSSQGGIAGFASKFKGPSIKIYKERQKYQEWEFVYDIKDDPYLKQRAPAGGIGPNNNGLGSSSSGGLGGTGFGNSTGNGPGGLGGAPGNTGSTPPPNPNTGVGRN
jgi:hypothetical protein